MVHTLQTPDIIKVASESHPKSVAGAIAGTIRDYGYAEVQAIGAGAVNQAVKAMAIATRYLAEDGLGIHMLPSFKDIEIGDHQRTAIRFKIESRANNVAL